MSDENALDRLDAVRVRERASFRCLPGTYDGCQDNEGDLVLCAHCQRLADAITALLLSKNT